MSVLNQIFSKIAQLLNWWVTVAPWEQALRVRLGKHVKLLEPGLHMRIPWVDRLYRQSIRLRTADFDGMQTLTTKDGHVLTVSGNIKYQIDDMLTLYNTLHHPQDTIIDMVMSAVAEYVSNHERSGVTPLLLQVHVRDAVCLEQFGLGNVRINITDFAYTPTFRLIQSGKRFTNGDVLTTNQYESPGGAVY